MVTEGKHVEEMMLDAEEAPEPGSDIRIESEEEGMSSNLIELKSAGYTYVYDKRTGDKSKINNNWLRQQLLKKDEKGKRIFTTDPREAPKPVRHNVKCLLHPDDPNREMYDSWGLPVCTAAHLASEYERDNHMRFKHKREWEAIQRDRNEQKEKQDRELQIAILEQASGRNNKSDNDGSNNDEVKRGRKPK